MIASLAGADLLLLLLKHSLTVAAIMLLLRCLAKASAARRVFAARCGLFALLLLPLVWLLLPELPLRLPYAWSAPLDPPLELPKLAWLASVPQGALAFDAPERAADMGRLLLCLYGAGVLLHAFRMALRLRHLRRIAAAATPVSDTAWCAALAHLSTEFGLRCPVRLLVSGQVVSPLSWGWRQPLIVIDPHSLASAAPDAILAHELAHIATFDWPVMLLARCLVALYWWHPLMHLLANTLEHDTECAADDAVLGSGVPASHYAQTLVMVSRHAYAPRVSLASPIAGKGAPLVARVASLLEAQRTRGKVSPLQWLSGAAVTALLVMILGTLALRGEHVVWPDQLIAAPGGKTGISAEHMLASLDNPNFRQLALAMYAGDFALRHAPGHATFRQRAAIPALMLALRDSRPVVRRLAAWGLGEMGFAETAPALAALLADAAPEVRAEAAGALGDLGETRWLKPMLAMLLDPDPTVRARVAHALGDLAEPASIPALTAATGDTDAQVAEQVRWALRELQ